MLSQVHFYFFKYKENIHYSDESVDNIHDIQKNYGRIDEYNYSQPSKNIYEDNFSKTKP